MSEIKVKVENVKAAAAVCEEWKKALTILFPEVFKEDGLKQKLSDISSFFTYNCLIGSNPKIIDEKVSVGLVSFAGSGEYYYGNKYLRARFLNEDSVRVHLKKEASHNEHNTHIFFCLTKEFAESLIKRLGITKKASKQVIEYINEVSYFAHGNVLARKTSKGEIIIGVHNSSVRNREKYYAFEIDPEHLAELYSELSCN